MNGSTHARKSAGWESVALAMISFSLYLISIATTKESAHLGERGASPRIEGHVDHRGRQHAPDLQRHSSSC